jgi:hypothetical protein
VPSFTSSFRTLPHGWRSLVIAAALAASFITGYELFWRLRGFRPMLTDSDSLWCGERTRLPPDGVALLGSSRLQTGIDPAELSRVLGGRAVAQLAIAGANPVPPLLDLADDPSFRGVVLLEYMPRRLFTSAVGSTARSQAFVSACKNPSLIAPLESRLERAVERHAVFLDDELQLVALLGYVAHHHTLPAASHDVLRADRYSQMYFPEGVRVLAPRDVWDEPLVDAALEQRLRRLHDAIAKIQARGGRVLLYRSPVSGDVLADEESRFPNNVWFARAARDLGISTIDYATLPDTRPLDLPDGEHPRSTDVLGITDAVAHAMQRLL